jgi:hypothetical protein
LAINVGDFVGRNVGVDTGAETGTGTGADTRAYWASVVVANDPGVIANEFNKLVNEGC